MGKDNDRAGRWFGGNGWDNVGKDEGRVEIGVIACRRMVGGEGSVSKVIYGRDKDLCIFKLYEIKIHNHVNGRFKEEMISIAEMF